MATKFTHQPEPGDFVNIENADISGRDSLNGSTGIITKDLGDGKFRVRTTYGLCVLHKDEFDIHTKGYTKIYEKENDVSDEILANDEPLVREYPAQCLILQQVIEGQYEQVIRQYD